MFLLSKQAQFELITSTWISRWTH